MIVCCSGVRTEYNHKGREIDRWRDDLEVVEAQELKPSRCQGWADSRDPPKRRCRTWCAMQRGPIEVRPGELSKEDGRRCDYLAGSQRNGGCWLKWYEG